MVKPGVDFLERMMTHPGSGDTIVFCLIINIKYKIGGFYKNRITFLTNKISMDLSYLPSPTRRGRELSSPPIYKSLTFV